MNNIVFFSFCRAVNRRVIFNLPDNKIDGDPDGMTIDTDGNLWVACFNSDNVIIIVL